MIAALVTAAINVGAATAAAAADAVFVIVVFVIAAFVVVDGAFAIAVVREDDNACYLGLHQHSNTTLQR